MGRGLNDLRRFWWRGWVCWCTADDMEDAGPSLCWMEVSLAEQLSIRFRVSMLRLNQISFYRVKFIHNALGILCDGFNCPLKLLVNTVMQLSPQSYGTSSNSSVGNRLKDVWLTEQCSCARPQIGSIVVLSSISAWFSTILICWAVL